MGSRFEDYSAAMAARQGKSMVSKQLEESVRNSVLEQFARVTEAADRPPATSKLLKSRRVRQKQARPSKWRGVFPERGAGKKRWTTRCQIDGKVFVVGSFDDEVEAARAYDEYMVKHNPTRVKLNFAREPGMERAERSSSCDTTEVNSDHETKAELPAGGTPSEEATGQSASPNEDGPRAKMGGRSQPSSKYRGVCWNKCNQSWKASIKISGKNTHIGYFDDMHEAALAYDLKAIEVRGNKAVLNFRHTTSSQP